MENQHSNESNSNAANDHKSDLVQGLNRATSKIADAVKETFGMNSSEQQYTQNKNHQ
ncbi:hypothetical protein [Peribacillus glennii]|uniref:hypothetical protein n=1 Tax=Peribacillus glennii TaxID=2303991 RepID=UPI0013150142|nr:hypothetical protein [Peribacillus glennii]